MIIFVITPVVKTDRTEGFITVIRPLTQTTSLLIIEAIMKRAINELSYREIGAAPGSHLFYHGVIAIVINLFKGLSTPVLPFGKRPGRDGLD